MNSTKLLSIALILAPASIKPILFKMLRADQLRPRHITFTPGRGTAIALREMF